MKSSIPETGKPHRKLVQRLQAFIRPGKKKTHRFSANVTGEEDWEVDEPQIRMSRAFAVMLVLHLVAVGGLFAFHVFGKDDREAELNATRSAHQNSLPPPAPPAKSTASLPAAPAAPRAEIVTDEPAASPAPQKHIFKAGETKMLIAAKFGVTLRELEDANREMTFKTGEILTIPQHQRVIGSITEKSDTVNPPIALIVATPSDDLGHRDFALKKGAEDPYAPVEPAQLAALTQEGAAVRTKTVKAGPESTVESAGGEPEEGEETEARTAPAPKVKKTTPAPVAVASAKPKPAATGSRSHVIGKGDTVYNVAKRYGLSPGEIMRANGISDPSRLQMGQVLKITVRR